MAPLCLQDKIQTLSMAVKHVVSRFLLASLASSLAILLSGSWPPVSRDATLIPLLFTRASWLVLNLRFYFVQGAFKGPSPCPRQHTIHITVGLLACVLVFLLTRL